MVVKLYYYKKAKREYCVYDAKFVGLIVSGTAEECATVLNYLLIHSFYSMVSKVE